MCRTLWCLEQQLQYMHSIAWVVHCGFFWIVCCWSLVVYSMMTFLCLVHRRLRRMLTHLPVLSLTFGLASCSNWSERKAFLWGFSGFGLSTGSEAGTTWKDCVGENKQGRLERIYSQLEAIREQGQMSCTSRRFFMGFWDIHVASLQGDIFNRSAWRLFNSGTCGAYRLVGD